MVAGQLPYDKFYIEPFAGMLGVLLLRKPSPVEIVNDLDGRVVNWWKVVRDRPGELERWIRDTPISKALFNEFSEEILVEECDVKRAGMFGYLLTNSFFGSGRVAGHMWSNAAGSAWHHVHERVRPLAERLERVRLECLDVLELLDGVSGLTDAVIYCDPPYPGTTAPGIHRGGAEGFDLGEFCGLLRSQRSAVAVSGTDSSGYELDGWRVSDLRRGCALGSHMSGEKRFISERLWMNYPDVVSDGRLF